MFKIGKKFIRLVVWTTLSVMILPGQSFGLSKPRLRISDYFGELGGINYLSPDDLGKHCYENGWGEKKGMLYTQRGGFFDIGHVREAADRTRYAVDFVEQNIMQSKEQFTFSMIEPTNYYVWIEYPDNWKDLDNGEQQKIAREVALLYGQYIAHQSLIWHELITWFGFASSGLFSEHISSFSWEDPYSDVMGTCLAVEALRRGGDYDEQITQLLDEKIEELKGEPGAVGQKAEKMIKDKWFTGGGYFFVEMKKRNFDVGFDDGEVSPWLVPGLFDDAAALPCPVPRADAVNEYDFKFALELDPKVAEKSKIYKAIHLENMKDRLQVNTHFPAILEYIQNEAELKNGHAVALPTLTNKD